MWKMDEAIKQSGKYTDQEVDALEALFADSRIVEQGSNENGSYIRWDNDIQLLYRVENISFDNAGRDDISYPAITVAPRMVYFAPFSTSNAGLHAAFIDSVVMAMGSGWAFVHNTAAGGLSFNVTFVCISPWKGD